MTDTNKNNQENEWSKREIGALWIRESPNQKYFSGHFTTQDELGVEQKVKVVIFTNKHKKKDNHPDFRIYKSEPQSAQTATVEQTTEQNVVEEELI
jgi:uncharacterized protein (DUF736 family)